MPVETGRYIALPENVWSMIDDCKASGIFGDRDSDVVRALLIPGLEQAVRAGATKLRTSKAD